jgi:hypothetical protein
MEFKKIVKILTQYGFYGFTVKREGNGHYIYKFRSIQYFTILISVKVIKIDPKTFGSKKLVTSILFNEIEINDFKDFITALKGIYQLHKKERVKLFKQTK